MKHAFSFISAVALIVVAAAPRPIAQTPPAAAQAPRPLTPEDTLAIQEIGEIQIAPDGSAILFTVSRTNLQTNRVESALMLWRPGQAAPVGIVGGAGAASIRWAPDSKRFAFIAPGGHSPGAAIHTMDLTTSTPMYGKKEICPIERGNSFLSKAGNGLSWSPDGSRIAFTGTNEPAPKPADPLVITRLQYKTRTAFSDNRRSHIFVVPADGGTPQAVTTGQFDEHSISWGGDGSEIVFLSNREKDPDANLNYDIYAVRTASGELRRVTNTPGVEMDPKVSPDGRSIAYIATTRPITTIDSVAEDAHVFAIPFAGGQARELNHALDRRSGSPEWTPDGKWVLFTAADRGRTVLYRVPAEGGAAVAVFDRPAQAGPLSVAATGALAFGVTDPSMPRELFRLDSPLSTSAPQQLTTVNAALLKRWPLVKPQTITFKSFDGTGVEGWLYPALTATGRAPMILSIHGGPHGAYGYAFNASFQLNASRGYATLALNPRGSTGYGQAFTDGCVNNWGGGDYKDLMAGVDHVLATHPEIDGARLGVMGGSYGGFMTNWVITQTPRFKVAVSSASLSNLISFYATSLYQDLVHAEFDGFPWEGRNFETLWKWSPLAHVKNVVTPTMFIHGEQDNDVHITQAEEMYTAMRRRGIEAVLVRYPREGHGLREPKHQLDRNVRTLQYMDKFLMPGGSKPTAATGSRN